MDGRAVDGRAVDGRGSDGRGSDGREALASPPLARPPRLRSLRAVARPGWGRRALYVLLSLPLGALYAAVFVGAVASVVLAVQGVGLLLAVALLMAARGLGGLERRLTRALLDVHIAADAPLRRSTGHPVRRLRLLVLSSSTWRTVAWLAVRVLLATALVATLASAVGGALTLIVDAPWSPVTAVPFGLVLLVVLAVLVVALDLQVRIAAAIAPRLLGAPPEEQLAQLQQTSQRLADRNRLARDLHDTIGHSLTASLLQATAARRTLAASPDDRPVDPAFARQALEHIETNTRTALAELDRALAVLRDEGSRLADGPDLSALDGLLAGLRDGGLPVTLSCDVPVESLPLELSRLAYRVVQEGTTNVLRHAGSPPTAVDLARSADAVVVRVRNAPAPGHGSRPGPGGGSGLRGLQERVAAVGGTLVAGPLDGGGFELRATLPVRT